MQRIRHKLLKQVFAWPATIFLALLREFHPRGQFVPARREREKERDGWLDLSHTAQNGSYEGSGEKERGDFGGCCSMRNKFLKICVCTFGSMVGGGESQWLERMMIMMVDGRMACVCVLFLSSLRLFSVVVACGFLHFSAQFKQERFLSILLRSNLSRSRSRRSGVQGFLNYSVSA